MEIGRSIRNMIRDPKNASGAMEAKRLKIDQSLYNKDKSIVGQTVLSFDPAKALTLGIPLEIQE